MTSSAITLTPAQATMRREFCHTLTRLSLRGAIDMAEFIREWRHNENGYINGSFDHNKTAGVCVFCGGEITGRKGKRFCNPGCYGKWQRRERAKLTAIR